MKELLKPIVGAAVMDGVGSKDQTIKMAKTLDYYFTHLALILKDSRKNEVIDSEYIEDVISNGLNILTGKKTK